MRRCCWMCVGCDGSCKFVSYCTYKGGGLSVPLGATVAWRESWIAVSAVCRACAEMLLLRDSDGEPRLRCWRLATSLLACFG